MPSPLPSVPVAVVVMGVSGSGKTTVGREAARRLGWSFVDADDLHPPRSRAKMRAGEGLCDRDREPWLQEVRGAIDDHLRRARPVVVACSALTPGHRHILSDGEPRVHFVWLDVPTEALRQRLESRQGHFAGPDLLASQLATLEPPEDGVRIVASAPLDDVVRAVEDVALAAAQQSATT